MKTLWPVSWGAINLHHHFRIFIISERTHIRNKQTKQTQTQRIERLNGQYSPQRRFAVSHFHFSSIKTSANKLTILSTKIVVTRYTFQTDWNQLAAPVNSGWCWHFLEDATRRWESDPSIQTDHTNIVLFFSLISNKCIWLLCGWVYDINSIITVLAMSFEFDMRTHMCIGVTFLDRFIKICSCDSISDSFHVTTIVEIELNEMKYGDRLLCVHPLSFHWELDYFGRAVCVSLIFL